jgi:hypothetical protein
MAASLIIEQEQGTYVGSRHSHNGYYAGDFSQPRYPGESRRRVPTVRTPSGDRPGTPPAPSSAHLAC